MITLFKKSVKNEPQKADLKGKTTTEIVEEIHETFLTEVDRLLSEVKIKKSLDSDKQDLMDKCERLKALGFGKAKEVLDAQQEIERLNQIKQQNESNKKIYEAINYFSVKYPIYKFITEQSVKDICQKYGLIYGEVEHYIGTVPDYNLDILQKVKIQADDECYQFMLTHWGIGGETMRMLYDTEKQCDIRAKQYNHNVHARGYSSLCPLEIVAPPSDFDLKNMEIKDYKLRSVPIPDPIVLKPVIFKETKYYLIITAWGLEAEDENVVNERMN